MEVRLISLRARLRSGFTLIELLVVIGIIAVLIGFAFPVFQGVTERAKKVQAKNDVTQIVTAVNAFYTEYGRYPSTAGTDAYFGSMPAAPSGTTGATNDLLFDVLRNNTDTAHSPNNSALVTSLNPRGVAFLDLRTTSSNTKPAAGVVPNNAAVTGGVRIGAFYDPWGSAYNVEIDTTYDNSIINPYTDAPGGSPLSTGVISWSLGKNNVLGGGGTEKGSANNYSSSGDVISWQ